MMSFVFAAVTATSALAQVQSGAGKIGWIDTGAFGADGGITKYINAQKAIYLEVKPRETELVGIQTKLKALSDDLAKLQAACQNPAIPCDTKTAAAKQDEYQRLQREGEFKKKEYDAAVDKRTGEVLGPLSDDILKAVQDYAKQKGFAAVLDIATLAQAHAILALDQTVDITKDFIAFYNSRPATTAATTAPK